MQLHVQNKMLKSETCSQISRIKHFCTNAETFTASEGSVNSASDQASSTGF